MNKPRPVKPGFTLLAMTAALLAWSIKTNAADQSPPAKVEAASPQTPETWADRDGFP